MTKHSLTSIFLGAFILLFCSVGLTQNCYQSYLETSTSHNIKFIGTFKNHPLYQEILSFHNGGGTTLNVVLLRTDTIVSKDFDICFEMDGGLKVDVSKVEQNPDLDSIYSLKDINNIYQILHAQLRYAWLDNEETKIVLKNDTIHLKYTAGSCISDCPYYDVVEKYIFKKGKFELVKHTTRKLPR